MFATQYICALIIEHLLRCLVTLFSCLTLISLKDKYSSFIVFQVIGEIKLDDKCVQALDTTRGGQLIALGGQLNSVKTGVIG